jgi:RNA polymerase sigma-70 factor, ECF subfamily
MSGSGTLPRERELIAAARAGDQDAFRHLVEPFRSELHAHCYRMLGSVHDAEDALQEALLRAWRGLPRFEERSSLRAWLYRIATNTCLTALERRRIRVLPIDLGPPGDPREDLPEPLSESVWVEPYPDERFGLEDGYAAPAARYEQREAVELAFVASLQHLPAKQRAVLILRDVLGYSAAEVAKTLETSVASVKSALQRARKAVEERLPDRSQQVTLRSIDDDRVRSVVMRYIHAWECADVDAVVALLAEDAILAMPPHPAWFRGREPIAAFYTAGPLAGELRWKHVATRASGQLAVGCYTLDEAGTCYEPSVVDVLALRGEEISEITAFVDPSLFRTLGLPERLPA